MNKVLVVDDEEDIGILMKAMLKSSRFSVVYASNIGDATKELKTDEFETVFLDLNLNYFGRKTETSKTIHTGTVQLKAYF